MSNIIVVPLSAAAASCDNTLEARRAASPHVIYFSPSLPQ